MKSYKNKNNLKKRQNEFQKISQKHPTRIPIIIEPTSQNDPILTTGTKSLIENNMRIHHLIIHIRNRLVNKTTNDGISSNEAIYIIINDEENKTNVIPATSDPLNIIYDKYKNKDGFLYVNYSLENVFGCIEKY